MKNKTSKILIAIIILLLAVSFVACNKAETATVTVLYGEGTGDYTLGSDVTISATVPTGKIFAGWFDGEKIVSLDNPYTFKVEKDVAFTATFKTENNACTITVTNGKGGGEYNIGDEVTAKATVPSGYNFDKWTENGVTVSTENPYIFTATGDRTIVAEFKEKTLAEYTVTLYKEKDKDFVILNLTDIQLHNGNSTDTFNTVVDELVERTNPDLIVSLGDLINDNNTYGSKTTAMAVIDKIDSFGIPWTFIFGNHDYETYQTGYVSKKDFKRSAMIEYAQSKDNCVFVSGPADVSGTTNYIVNIVEKGTNKLVESLYMLDSGLEGLDDTHTAFYRKAVDYTAKLNGNQKVDSIIYTHIAIPPYGDAYEIEKRNQFANTVGSVNREACDLATGTKTLFPAILELGCTKNVVCGHDHENAYYMTYQGVNLIYTMKSSDGDNYTAVSEMGGSTFTIGDEVSFKYEKSTKATVEVVEPMSFTLDELPLWQYSGATFSFDFVLTDTVKKGNVQFSLLGTNVKRTQLPESDRYGQWNRLTNYLTINTTTMTPSVGTITELGNGKYHFEVNLLDVALNGGSGEVADGTETLRLMYFSTVNRSFNISNIGYSFYTPTTAPKTDLSSAVVDSIADIYYDGFAKSPALSVKVAGVALNPKTDYKVIYENNVEIGTATAIILPSGFGAEKWTGQKEVTFNIIANPDADTNEDHINAKLVTANAGFEGKDFAVVENWKTSGATFTFEYKKLTVTEPTSGNSARFSLMDVHNGWIRLSQHFTLNFSTNKVTCGGAEVGTIKDIGDGWYRFSIALADVPMNDSAGEVATGTETLKLVYFDNITRAFKIDNLTAE